MKPDWVRTLEWGCDLVLRVFLTVVAIVIAVTVMVVAVHMGSNALGAK